MIGPIDVRLPDELIALAPLVAQRFAPASHGRLPDWLEALQALPPLTVTAAQLGDCVTLQGDASTAERRRLETALMALHPWRKGPFELFGVVIDTEWRSDWKWRRVAPHLADLHGQRVLDVGCGNGYFGWRMLEAGARAVVGVDPTLLFCLQHQAVNHYLDRAANQVLPLRLEELPDAQFDTVFSMGVVYHRRDPADHVARLFRHCRPGGQVVLESLVVRGPEPLIPGDRYARMRNVWIVPTVALLQQWLTSVGFTDVRLVDVTPTSTEEQRSTAWMRFESLEAALDPQRADVTVEGHPAPLRAVAVGRKPV